MREKPKEAKEKAKKESGAKRKKKERSKSWGEDFLHAGIAFLSFLSLVHFTLFFLCYQLLGDGGAMLAASATRADGAEELMAEELIAEKL